LARRAATSFAALLPIIVAAGAGYGILNPMTAKAVMSWFPRRPARYRDRDQADGAALGGARRARDAADRPRARVARIGQASAAATAALSPLTWLLYRDPPERDAPAPGASEGV
jgi:hypothetical protein